MPLPSGRKRILSGVQPSGKLHLGNYFGAIKQHIALQDEGECLYFIADYHALTTVRDLEKAEIERVKQSGGKPAKAADLLRANVRDVAIDYLALGLDPAKVAFFRQSDVPEVTELTWILSTVAGMGLLERAHSFKDKIAKGIAPSVGLFTYPVLMAADILIYRSHLVPVGQDQVQHLEMTRDMAGSFNHVFGVEVFPMPQPRLSEAPIVPGTDGKKMSKTVDRSEDPEGRNNAIEIFAEGKALKKTVMGIVTDSKTVEEPKDPATCNVFALYSLFATPAEKEEMAARYRAGGMGYGVAKQALLEKIDATFGPAREKRKELVARPDFVEDVLRDGARKARAEALKTMELVRQATGLR